ncbi:MAG: dephospho-CoA kinase [Desulfotignum sp.]|nr:dephospho-CoA kinase [Desulfotignum sp.]MCF8087217.1 dephospho-CoA kinase [Desulfotignum sp.]MCF8138284.1 dephospho-CoA kinase [Desulfotignum sp.]
MKKIDPGKTDKEGPIRRIKTLVQTNRSQYNCLIVAVTGSIACGKSTVSCMLQDRGARLIDFDRIAREVVMPGTQGYQRIVSDFGAGVVQPDATLDRKALSDIVFADDTKRRHLEQITHPLIFDTFGQKLTVMTADYPDTIIQVAVPLLIELNMQHVFDKVIVVYLPREIQIKRLAARENISVEAAKFIIRSQLSPEEKKQYAQYVIDNRHDLAHTQEQVNRVWQLLLQDKQQRQQNTNACQSSGDTAYDV